MEGRRWHRGKEVARCSALPSARLRALPPRRSDFSSVLLPASGPREEVSRALMLRLPRRLCSSPPACSAPLLFGSAPICAAPLAARPPSGCCTCGAGGRAAERLLWSPPGPPHPPPKLPSGVVPPHADTARWVLGLPEACRSPWEPPPVLPPGAGVSLPALSVLPRFCGECLQPCLQVPSPLCPLCRMPFDPKKVEKASSVEKQLSSYKAPCRGCSKKVTLAKMRSHVSSCAKVQEQMANCPKFVPVVPTSQPIPSNIPNRSTFVCPYCGARNLDQQELVKHCMENHRNDPNKVVCPVCSAMPWGDPSYKSANFLQHLLHRHKFSYDTFVDYNIDEEAALQAALALSLSEN
uniref:RING-type E3 ubiquitin transferase n=1 Tax=Anser cygnoides TaxID=8845 RepID=A0A8B9DBF7_ANSCY|nr:E3 ubiquitin-protein ligase RNF166 isoform X1 [Anser cygnoides]